MLVLSRSRRTPSWIGLEDRSGPDWVEGGQPATPAASVSITSGSPGPAAPRSVCGLWPAMTVLPE